MSRRRTRIGRTAAVALLIAMLSAGAVAKGASEPSPSAEIGRWPTGVELRASLAPLGYSIQIDEPGDAPATVRLLVVDDARLTQLLDVGTAMGVPNGILLEVTELVRGSGGVDLESGCAYTEWAVAGGRMVLWTGATRYDAELELAFEPRTADDPGLSGANIPGSGNGIPSSAEEACQTFGESVGGGASPTPMPSLSAAGSSVVLSVEAREFAFSPAELKIPASGTSKIVLHDEGRLVHNFTVDALEVQVVASAGGSAEVTIVDPTPGTYEFYCSISGHRESGMVGTLTVE